MNKIFDRIKVKTVFMTQIHVMKRHCLYLA